MISFRALTFSCLVATTALLAGCACHGGSASGADAAHRNTIAVIGVGKAQAKPDVARIQIGVETRAATVAEASQQNTDQIARLHAALRSEQIADKDIRTSNYSVYFEQTPEPGYPTPVVPPAAKAAPAAAPRATPAGFYRVSNQVEIVVRDLGRVGKVLDAAVAAGANNIGGLQFTLEDDSKLEAEIRAKAVADAGKRAAELAKLGKLELGDIVSISEVNTVRYGVPMMREMAQAAKADTAIEAGELSFDGQVEVVYAIKR